MNPILFYDSTCPLCSKEIRLLKRLSNNRLALVDIHSLNDAHKPSKQDMLKILHINIGNDQWMYGLDATVHAWSFTPYGFLFKVLRCWPFKKMADRLYKRWAEKRYQQRYHCAQCGI